MLSYDLFDSEFELMADLLSYPPRTPAGKIAYYDAVSELGDRRFSQACKAAIAEIEHFPKPSWVLNRAKEIANSEAISSPAISAAVDEYCPMPEGWKEQYLRFNGKAESKKSAGFVDLRDFEWSIRNEKDN